ncbi:serine hydrolase FSH [Hypomontagnella submonticulosa]|nr:serine hydrolase FSH [Hypomontagnella submonticulosa]
MQPLSSQSKISDPSLHYPRILCLHGGGVNSRIFRIACRVLESQLADCARLVYADAPFFAPPGPLITGSFTEWGPFRSWLPPALGVGPGKGQGVERIDEDPTDVELVVEKIEQSLRSAMEGDDRAGGAGPWVALLGFSQGAKIAASLILRQEHEPVLSTSLPAFHFGVLIAGPAPLVWLLSSPDHPMPQRSSPKSILRTPTIHVHGTHDSVLSSPHEWIYQSCSPDSRKLLEWDGDHFVPTRTEDVAAVVVMITELLNKYSQ